MRDYSAEFQALQKTFNASDDADLAQAADAPPMLEDPSAATPRPEAVRGEVRINGRNMNAVLADLLERS
jgi:hypothetical protein